MIRKNKIQNPYESHNRTAICALCQQTFDEKMIKIFVYHGKISKIKIDIYVCRKCENKKHELENLVKKIILTRLRLVKEGKDKKHDNNKRS